MRGVSVWAYRELPSGHLFPGVGDGIHEVAPLATEGKVMRPPFVVSLLAVALLAVAFAALPSSEAPTGFDNQSNGMVDEATHQADQVKFDEVENVSDGLGPLYNAQSCRECHQSRYPAGAARSPSCGWATREHTTVLRTRRSPSRAEPRSSPGAPW